MRRITTLGVVGEKVVAKSDVSIGPGEKASGPSLERLTAFSQGSGIDEVES